jgi:OmpA-OmpF porin, OOP family
VVHPESKLPDTKFNFDVASTKLTRDSEGSVDELAQFLKSSPDSVIHIEGFADSTGNGQANETLSENRAAAIKDALVAKGIDANRIETSGMGESSPIAPNDNVQNRAQNRRAEVTLVH